MKNILGYVLLVGLLSVVSFGDTFHDGMDAYDNKDYKTAFSLFEQACDNGNSSGCGMVGVCYEHGDGTQQNNQAAFEYYTKACNNGDSIGCEDRTRLQNKIPVGCTKDELSFLNNKRYFFVGSSIMNPSIVADAKTIRIDRKNKVIQVWITSIVNHKSRDKAIQILGQDYNNIGYTKDLSLINYGNMTYKSNTFSYYNCDGSIIKTFGAGEWMNILPESVREVTTDSIMKKYGLK